MAGESILIVDDNAQNLKLARIVLEGAGFTVSTASDAEDALSRLRKSLPALILMDIQLPGMDGLTLTRQLKQEPEFSAVIVIAVTAYAMKGDEERALQAGCDGYITKPIDVAGLAAQVRGFLDR